MRDELFKILLFFLLLVLFLSDNIKRTRLLLTMELYVLPPSNWLCMDLSNLSPLQCNAEKKPPILFSCLRGLSRRSEFFLKMQYYSLT